MTNEFLVALRAEVVALRSKISGTPGAPRVTGQVQPYRGATAGQPGYPNAYFADIDGHCGNILDMINVEATRLPNDQELAQRDLAWQNNPLRPRTTNHLPQLSPVDLAPAQVPAAHRTV
jgi:hypothetical protein